MCLTVSQFCGAVGINKWIFEEAELELGAQDPCYSLIDCSLCHSAFGDKFRQLQVTIRVRQFDVNTCFEGAFGGFSLVGGDLVARDQLRDTVVIRCDQTTEAPFLPQN